MREKGAKNVRVRRPFCVRQDHTTSTMTEQSIEYRTQKGLPRTSYLPTREERERESEREREERQKERERRRERHRERDTERDRARERERERERGKEREGKEE